MTRARQLAAALVLSLAGTAAGAIEPAFLVSSFTRAHGVLETRSDCQFLDIWVAVTDEQRGQGLMYVREMGEREGMLFLAPQPARLSMWMRNTYIPLDMLFIRTDRKVSSIAADAEPLSEKKILSKEDVIAVLELNGGYAARHGVKPGDRFTLVPN